MKKLIWLCASALGIALIFTASVTAKSGDPGKLMAFPNPFDPQSQTLQITKENKTPFATNAKVRFSVYAINGKKVYEDTQSGALKWHGYTSEGVRVAPGFYYIRIIEEDVVGDDKTMATKIIKLLVK